MKRKLFIFPIFISSILIGCNSNNEEKSNDKTSENMEEKKNESTSSITKDTTPKVTGVGGIFFFSENPKEAGEWYKKNLGIDASAYGYSFETRNLNNPDEVQILQWTPFKQGSEYFAPSKRDFMINYTVQNIEGLVQKLRANGVTIVDSITSYDYGKFVHIMDEEGNKIELWEPVNEVRKVKK